MKNIYIIITIMALCSFGCNHKTKDNNMVGHLKIIKGNHDFGLVKKESILRGYFILQNTSDITLYYKKIYSDCDCTKIINPKDSLVSGQIDTLNFSIDTKGMIQGQIIENSVRVIANAKPEMSKLFVKFKIEE